MNGKGNYKHNTLLYNANQLDYALRLQITLYLFEYL
jgi:hypothetical protein